MTLNGNKKTTVCIDEHVWVGIMKTYIFLFTRCQIRLIFFLSTLYSRLHVTIPHFSLNRGVDGLITKHLSRPKIL